MPNRIIRDALLDSEKYNALQIEARLAFFEILLRADDYGLIPLANLWLRRHCPVFDGRSIEFADGVLSALADQDLIRVYVNEGKRFAFIPQFGNRPQAIAPKYPLPPATLTNGAIEEAQRQAKNLPRTLKRQSERNQGLSGFEQGSNMVPTGLESPETETETEVKELNHAPPTEECRSRTAARPYQVPDCPYQKLVDSYHAHLPANPRVEVLSPQRKRHIQARWRHVCADGKLDLAAGLDWFESYFKSAGQSGFLTGKKKPDPGRKPFFASLDFLMDAERFVNVYEGKYAEA